MKKPIFSIILIFFAIRYLFAFSKIIDKETFGPLYFIENISAGKIPSLTGSKADIAVTRWKIALQGANYAQRRIPLADYILSNKTALLVVDMQKGFLDKGAAIEVPEGRNIVSNINDLADNLRNKGGLIIFFRYLVDENVGMLKHFEGASYLGAPRVSPIIAFQKGHPQFELYPDLNVKEKDIVLDKIRYSAVIGSEIVDLLQKRGIENVIITGVTTDVCAGNTAEDLMQKDFYVVMVWDGCAALDRLEHEIYLARIFGLYGDVMPTKEVLMRLK